MISLSEAEAEWDRCVWYVMDQASGHGMLFELPDGHYRACYLFEVLSGDYIPPPLKHSQDPAVRLSLWADRFRQFKGIDPQLTSFLVDQINLARRGA